MLERQQLVRLLRQVPLLHGLGPNDLSGVAAAAQCREIERRRFFFRQGTIADAVYVLNRGRVKLTQSTPKQAHVLLRFIAPGEMFDLTSLDGQPYTLSAEATRWSQAVVWKVPTMIALMERYPSIAVNALREMAARLQELRERYRELATERVERRVAHALIRLAREAGWRRESGFSLVDIPLSRQDLAEMTGTTLYTVSRILAGWRRDGIIESGRQRLAILQPSAVQAIAEDLPGATSGDEKPKT
ncbi:MAG: Crp/Fnr family transcriptional regulator [bacterium]